MTVNINNGAISAIRLVEQASNPATPSTGSIRLFVDNSTVYNNTLNSNTPLLKMIADDGTVTTFIGNVTASGVGITFPPQQVASSNVNTLDDYEEGTWTPDIRSSAGPGTATYSEAVGTYTKIGRFVQATAIVTWSGHTQSGGTLRMGNFPFNPTSSDNMASIGYFHNITLATNNVATALIPAGSNQMFFYQYPISGGAATLVNMDTAGSIYVTITYTV